MDYKTANLEHRTTKWLKEHCILECRANNEPSSWVQTATNEQRRHFLLTGEMLVFPASTEKSTAPNSNGLESMIVDAVVSKVGTDIDDRVDGAIRDVVDTFEEKSVDLTTSVKDMVDKKLSELKQPIQINIGEAKPVDVKGSAHEKMVDVIECLQIKKRVLLVGPSGTGKSTLVQNAWSAIAPTIGLEPKKSMQYIACSGGLSEAQLLGKMDANGGYHNGLVVDAFENGGLNLFDEADGFDPNVALVTHAMTDNQGFIALPNRTDDPMAFKHDNYYHAEIANTWGDGMDFSYSGRMQQDSAKMDRFGDVKIWVDYDRNLERDLVGVFIDWAEMLWDLRTRLIESNLDRRFVSTRRFYDANVWAEVGKPKSWFLNRITVDYTDEEKSKISLKEMVRSYK